MIDEAVKMMKHGIRDLGTLASNIDGSSAAVVEVLLRMVIKSEEELRQQAEKYASTLKVDGPALARQPSHGTRARGELVSLSLRLSMDEFKKVLETILKILGNIKREPGAQKFRSLKKDNALVASTLLANQEAMDILYSAGFEMSESTVELKLLDLDRLTRVINVVQEHLEETIREWNDMY
jgi:hypothetical protein